MQDTNQGTSIQMTISTDHDEVMTWTLFLHYWPSWGEASMTPQSSSELTYNGHATTIAPVSSSVDHIITDLYKKSDDFIDFSQCTFHRLISSELVQKQRVCNDLIIQIKQGMCKFYEAIGHAIASQSEQNYFMLHGPVCNDDVKPHTAPSCISNAI